MEALARTVQSFRNAFHGLAVLVVTQRNARVHLVAALVAIAAGLVAELSSLEWIALTLTITAVVVTEALNTAIEFLADAAVPEHHPLIAKCKDVAAAAVLLTAIASLVVGAFLFGTKLW